MIRKENVVRVWERMSGLIASNAPNLASLPVNAARPRFALIPQRNAAVAMYR